MIDVVWRMATVYFYSLSSSGGMINAAEVSNYSGSGSGLPLLIQRSVARQISLVNVIGTCMYSITRETDLHELFIKIKTKHIMIIFLYRQGSLRRSVERRVEGWKCCRQDIFFYRWAVMVSRSWDFSNRDAAAWEYTR